MSWQTKGRIEIYGQGGPCDRSRIEVSHSYPALLAGYIEPQAWESFCLALDQCLEPAQKIKNLTFNLMIFALVLLILMFIWTCVMYSSFERTSASWDDSFWVWWIVIGGLTLFVPLFVLLKVKRVTFQVANELKRLCDAESNKYPQIQFQVRFEAVLMGGGGGALQAGRDVGFKTFNYIEIQMAPSAMPQNPVAGQYTGVPIPMVAAAGNGMVGGVYGGGVPMATIPSPAANGGDGGGGAKTAAERFAELQALKPMLSDDEYKAKKAEILNSL
jgi:uncharacterized membrane protein